MLVKAYQDCAITNQMRSVLKAYLYKISFYKAFIFVVISAAEAAHLGDIGCFCSQVL